MSLTVRWATASDLADRYAGQTVRAKVAERDGRVAGLVGYFVRGGIAYVFSEVREPLPKMLIWREAMAMMARVKVPAVCVADQAIPGACRFLERMGWQHAGSSSEGEVYAWQP